MDYLYGNFSDEQIEHYSKLMHNEIHKLLLYEDPEINETIFDNENDFINYFNNLLVRFAGLNELLFYPVQLINLMATLQSAYVECRKSKDDFNYKKFRRLILDAHGFITSIFGEVRHAKH